MVIEAAPLGRLACYHLGDPWVNDCFEQFPSESCERPGIEVQNVHRILSSLGIQSRIISAKTEEGVLELVANGTADLPCFAHDISNKLKYPELEVTMPVEEDQLVFVIKERYKLKNSLLCSNVVFSLFSLELLILMLMLFILIHLWMRLTKDRLIVTTFFLTLTLLLGVYGNLLSIQLSQPFELYKPFKDMQDLSEKLLSGKLRLSLNEQDHHTCSRMVGDHKWPPDDAIRDRFKRAYKKNPPDFRQSDAEVVKGMLETMSYYKCTGYSALCEYGMPSLSSGAPVCSLCPIT